MKTRIRLRRTASAINTFSNASNEDHHLRYGEALYSTADHALVIGGSNTSNTISQIQNRFFAHVPQKKNLVYAGPASGSTNAYPTFRALVAADIPSGIPSSKISGFSSVGSSKQPIYFNNSSVPTAISYTIEKSVPSNAVFTDRYVNSAAFSYNSTDDNITLTLTRAGSDTVSKTANIPKVSTTTAGVVPKGTKVTTQSQTTKFLRQDGTWATPSYTVNVVYTFANGTDGSFTVTPSGGTAQKVTIGKPATAGTADKIGTGTVGSAYAPVYIKSGTPTVVTGNKVLVNLSSTSTASIFQEAPRPGVTGTLAVSNGGTGKSSWTTNGVLYANSTSTLNQLTPSSSSQVLMSDSSKKPTWSDPSSLLLSALDSAYIWDTAEFKPGYTGEDNNLLDLAGTYPEYPLGSAYGGFVALSELSGPLSNGTQWENYYTQLSACNYSITVYTGCTKSFDASSGNIIYNLTGGVQRTFNYSKATGSFSSAGPLATIYSTGGSKDVFTTTGPCYVVPGIHDSNYQCINPEIPTTMRLASNPTSLILDVKNSTNWLLYFHRSGSETSSMHVRLTAFQCILKISDSQYKVCSGLQMTYQQSDDGDTWGYTSDYDVVVSYAYYKQKGSTIYYNTGNWETSISTATGKTHGLTTSNTARKFTLRRGSLASYSYGKNFIKTRVGDGTSSFRISFPETQGSSTFYNIPRLIIYGNGGEIMTIDTLNLSTADTQPGTIVDSNLVPVPGSYAHGVASWYPTISGGSSQCRAITITLDHEKLINLFNKLGQTYTYYAYS